MPLLIDTLPGDESRFGKSRGRDCNSLRIALVNNMRGPAFLSTERQFRSLLLTAADEVLIRISRYVLEEECGGDREGTGEYGTIRDLWRDRPDAIIVTGVEPRRADLREESYWGALATLVDWAEENTRSSIWSCLAAHAAVLHLDGIVRRPLPEKLFGIFDCSKVEGGSPARGLVSHIEGRRPIPHSRWNDISGGADFSELRSGGYEILLRSPEAGADTFVKRRKSLFLFFQGHPEYEAETLLHEYRRDIRRFLRGERESYPDIPKHCFGAADMATLRVFEQRAANDRRENLMAEFPSDQLGGKMENVWRASAVGIYRNWLRYLREPP